MTQIAYSICKMKKNALIEYRSTSEQCSKPGWLDYIRDYAIPVEGLGGGILEVLSYTWESLRVRRMFALIVKNKLDLWIERIREHMAYVAAGN